MGFGGSAAMMPGSVTPIYRPCSIRCLACPMVAPFIGPFIAPGPQPVQTSSPRRPISYPTFLVYLYSSLPIEWPPQHTTRLGRDLKSRTRELRSTWNTALVMDDESVRSNRPLAMISLEI